jgi:hypothetical protein
MAFLILPLILTAPSGFSDVEEPIDAPVADNAPTDANTSYEQTAKVVALVLLAVFLVICAAGAVFGSYPHQLISSLNELKLTLLPLSCKTLLLEQIRGGPPPT